MSRVDFDALNALRTAATGGAWVAKPADGGVHSEVHAVHAPLVDRVVATLVKPTDAKLIADVVTLFPSIEAEIRQLRRVALAAMQHRDACRFHKTVVEEVQSAMALDLEISALLKTADPRNRSAR